MSLTETGKKIRNALAAQFGPDPLCTTWHDPERSEQVFTFEGQGRKMRLCVSDADVRDDPDGYTTAIWRQLSEGR